MTYVGKVTLRSTDIDKCGGQDRHCDQCSVNDICGKVVEEHVLNVLEGVRFECTILEIIYDDAQIIILHELDEKRCML